VYQFPLPADAQIDGLALDVKDAPGGFEEGAFLDKQRAQKIWNGVIEKATQKKLEIARDEIIWVDGSWRDPALLDWKRGGRFELRIFPIPAKGSRTIKIAYTQIVTPRGPWRQYVYPLPHSADGSTVADNMTVDVEVRGAVPGQIRTAGYDMNPDPVRADVSALTLKQTGFVPRGDLVVDYRAADGDAEVRAWTFTGGFAVAPDEKLAEKKNVGIDPKVIEAQRAVASDTRPTAVVALRPKLPRWREAKEHDYMIVVDSSQSMVGERYTRATELTQRLIEQMDRRDRFTVMACDSECREMGEMQTPSVASAKEAGTWLAASPAAGASDIVAAIRTAAGKIKQEGQRERWVLFIGDGFASTGFRKAGDVEQAIAASTKGINVTTIGLGTDADSAVLGAVARAGGGSYLAWVPGQSVKTAAVASLESTFGSALRNATIELPSGLVDVAPTILPTIRTGDEVLVAARLTGDVQGDVIIKGTVGGEPFEQRYPLELAVSAGAGNRFVPRLWASLAIDQLERKTDGGDRVRIVALSQGYGVMSKETSLLVLESAAMFEAFGVDRSVPSAKFTGQEALDEVTSTGTLALSTGNAGSASGIGRGKNDEAGADNNKKIEQLDDQTASKDKPAKRPMPKPVAPAAEAPVDSGPTTPNVRPVAKTATRADGRMRGGMFAMRRSWVRVPSISAYDSVAPNITKAIGDAERALAKTPDSRERHRALVQALSYAGEIERANAVAAKWLDRDRLDPQALGYQADLMGRDGKRDEALRLLAGVVDLDADRTATHERMVTAYEHVGRMSQACSHRIALSAIQPKDGKVGASAVRCLRTLSRDADAQLIMKGLADDAARAAADKALLAADAAPKAGGDLVVNARWEGGADLDLSLVTPDGTRVSWMGGRTDVRVADATSTEKEQLTIKSLKRGHYLLEVARGAASTGTMRGTLDLVVLGSKKSVPFELGSSQARKTIARVSVNMEERVETIDMSAAVVVSFGNIPNPTARRILLARSGDVQR
nr:VWA domain-containing protein [Deltaproteobacteria bacterium]